MGNSSRSIVIAQIKENDKTDVSFGLNTVPLSKDSPDKKEDIESQNKPDLSSQ